MVERETVFLNKICFQNHGFTRLCYIKKQAIASEYYSRGICWEVFVC